MKKIITKKWISNALMLILSSTITYAQNVSISAPPGTAPNPAAGLDVNFTDRGVLIPRISLTNTGTWGLTGTAVNSMLVFNTNAGIAGTGAAGVGYYYWNSTAGRWVNLVDNVAPGTPWFVGLNTETGAAGTAYNFGHVGNHHVDIYTNNQIRGRFSNLGEFFWGTTNTALPGDLTNSVGNATFPWALNGYTSFDGGAVYGGIQGGTTIFAAVQGETQSTNAGAAGVRGVLLNNGGGTGFGSGVNFGVIRSGVNGDGTGSGSYRFGVYGRGGTSTRSGAVLGEDYGFARGALGYLASNNNDYAVYGFNKGYTNGVVGGKMSSNTNQPVILNEDHSIGLGIYGGVMGGWIKGLVYGANFSGNKYGVYVHGKTLTNDIIATLHNNETSSKRTITYAAQSMKAEVSDKGKSRLNNGVIKVYFSPEFTTFISSPEDIIINITPIGASNGLYIESIERDGFTVKENGNGQNSITFFWTAFAPLKNVDTKISEEILDISFEEKMNGPKGVMYNDNNPESPEYSLWWDGEKVRFDMPEIKDKPIPESFYETCRMCQKKEIKNKN